MVKLYQQAQQTYHGNYQFWFCSRVGEFQTIDTCIQGFKFHAVPVGGLTSLMDINAQTTDTICANFSCFSKKWKQMHNK